MRKLLNTCFLPTFLFLICLQLSLTAFSQENLKKLSINEVHFSNGMGWAIPYGEISEVLRPKFSGNTALYISIKDKPWYLNPSLDLLVYGYNQSDLDGNFENKIENGRALSYALNLTGGYRKTFSALSISAFIGPGISLFAEPRASYDPANSVIKLSRTHHLAPTLKTGLHADYKIRNVYLYVETSWQTHFIKVQNHKLNQFILLGGLKTNITRVTDEVIRILEKP